MKKIYLSLITLGINSFVWAKESNVFWFAPPEISAVITTFDGKEADRPVKLHFSTETASATVIITQPANPAWQPITLNVTSGNITTVDLTDRLAMLETTPAATVLPTGLKIEATAPISAWYAPEHFANPESFVLKGDNALGTEFYIPGQNIGFNGQQFSPSGWSSFDIVATQPGTTITITPARDIVGHSALTPFSITLNAGETWSATATGQNATDHLVGSHITSDKPIAVTYKDDLLMCADVGSGYDLVGDQLLPVTKLGTKYVAVKGNLDNAGDRVFVTAAAAGTEVRKNGNLLATLAAGETHIVSMQGENAFTIETSKPAVVFQLSGMGAELGGKQLLPINAYSTHTASYQRLMGQDLYLTLVVPQAGINAFQVNGSPLSAGNQFSPVPGSTDLMFAKVTLDAITYPQDSKIILSNPVSGFQAGFLDGWLGWGLNYILIAGNGGDNETGVHGQEKQLVVKLYPNPAQHTLYVDAAALKTIEVFDLLGQKQSLPYKLDQRGGHIDVHLLAPGSYIIKLAAAGGNAAVKFVKD